MEETVKDPYDLAITDYYYWQDTSAQLTVHVTGVVSYNIGIDMFFEQYDQLFPLNQKAIQLCKGRVLDIGAGVGRFALPLQERGLDVCAIDYSETAVKIMQEKGVQNAQCMTLEDILDNSLLPEERFDTVLLMMNGMGIVGSVTGLQNFLEQVKNILKPTGQIIADSTDVQVNKKPEYRDLSKTIPPEEKYFGEVEMSFEYKGNRSDSVPWVYLDEWTLKKNAEKTGWHFELMDRMNTGMFLVRLTLK